jgi:hypothetical protein
VKAHQFLILLFLSLYFIQVQAFDLSDVSVPTSTDSVWVGRGIEHNGVIMDIKTLKTQHSSEQVVAFYKNMWEMGGKEGEGYVTSDAGEYKVISSIVENHNVVVQIKNGRSGGAEGYLSSIDLASLYDVDVEDDFPTLSNTMLISKTRSDDEGKTAVTRIFMNHYSVASNSDFYEDRLSSHGWKRTFEKAQSDAYTAFYSKNKTTMEMAISKETGKGTVIFVNIVNES